MSQATSPQKVPHGTALILYSSVSPWLDAARFAADLARLPQHEQDRIRRQRRPEAQRSSLIGRLLLSAGLEHFGLRSSPLEALRYTGFGKPFLPGELSFNISHSGDYVVCAIAAGTRIGIDIEEVAPLDLDSVTATMDAAQWQEIATATRPLQRFYALWTMKESVSKCRGEGLNLPLQAMSGNAIEAKLSYGGEPWTCQQLAVAPGYICHAAAKIPPTKWQIQRGL